MPYYTQTEKYHLPPGTNVMVGDVVTGPGVSAGTTVTAKDVKIAGAGGWNGYSTNSTYIEIEMSSMINTDANGITNYNYANIIGSFTGVNYKGWSGVFSFSREEEVNQPNPTVYLNGSTLSFREDVKGWVSFKSFTPENAISCANEYYTFYNSGLWKHHSDQQQMNIFYGVECESSFTVILNDIPSSVKSFKTLNYEGSQARVLGNLEESGSIYEDGQYYNLVPEAGWYVFSTETVVGAETDLEKGGVSEFIEKEGKWFGYFTGEDINVNIDGMVVGGFNSADFSVQGIGMLEASSQATIIGCTDPTAFNYDGSATEDDGSCEGFILGCTNADADNYDPNANTDDGTCGFYGCTDPTAFNYDPNATIDDSTCIDIILGCTDDGSFNYYALANVDDGSCIDIVAGCIDPSAFNFDALANTSDGSCVAVVLGCTASLAFNYNSSANTDDGSCIAFVYGCTDSLANNYDASANTDDGSCDYCIYGCAYTDATNYDSAATCDDGTCLFDDILGCTDATACNHDATANTDNGSCGYCGDQMAYNYDGVDATCDNGCTYCTPPTDLVFSDVGPDYILIEWSQSYPSNDAGGLVYYLQVGNSTAVTLNASNIIDAGQSTMSYLIENLTPSSGYSISLGRSCGVGITDLLMGSATTEEEEEILGCTDANGSAGGYNWGACNYDALANTDDDSCFYDLCAGCADPDYEEYCDDCWDDVLNVACSTGSGSSDCGEYTVSDSSQCLTVYISGCTNPNSQNYNPSATLNDGSCIAHVLGCLDPTQHNNNTSAFANYNCLPGNTTYPCSDGITLDDGVTCIPLNNCPSLSSSINGSTELVATYSCNNTIYDSGLTGGYYGYPEDPIEIDVFVSTTEAVTGTTTLIADLQNSAGWSLGNINSNYWDKDMLSFLPGQSEVLLATHLTTDDAVGCSVIHSKTYTVGCTDTNASNYNSSAPPDFPDVTQCDYTGCMDATLANNGAYFATNYSSSHNIACNDGSGENSCCEYKEAKLEFSATLVGGVSSAAYHYVDLELDTTGTAYGTGGGSNNLVNSHTTVDVNNLTATPTLIDTIDDITPEASIGAVYTNGAVLADQNLTLSDFLIQGSWYLVSNIDNASRNNQIVQYFTNHQYQRTMGCKYGGSGFANYNPTVQLMQKDSCIPLTASGCLEPGNFNYDDSLNVDCTGTYVSPNQIANGDYGDDSCCFDDCLNVGTLSVETPLASSDTIIQLYFTTDQSAYAYEVEVVTDGVTYNIVVELPSAEIVVGGWNLPANSAAFVIAKDVPISFKVRAYCYDGIGSGTQTQVITNWSNTVTTTPIGS